MNDAHDTPLLRPPSGGAVQLIAPGAAPPEPGALPWRSYAHVLAGRRWLVAAVALLCTLVALVYAVAARPVYEANLLLHVEEDNPNASRNILNDVSSLFETKKAAIAEMELLRSRLVVARAVDAQHLYIQTAPRYFPLGGAWLAARGDGRLSRPGLLGYGGYVWGGESIAVCRFEVPLAWYNRDFFITALGGGRYRLSDAGGRVLLEGAAGALAHQDGDGVELQVESLRAQPGGRFVVRRTTRLAALEQLQNALQISEQGKQSGVIAVRLQGHDAQQVAATLGQIGAEYMRQNLARRSEEAEKTLAFLDQQLPALKAQLEQAELRYNGYRGSHGSINIDQEVRIALDSLAAAQARRSAQVQRRAELLGRYTDEHPLLRALNAQARASEREIGALQERIAQLPLLEQEQSRLAREVKVDTDLYTALLNTAQQLRLVAVGRVGNVRLVDAPVAPERALLPDRPLIVVLGLVTGLFLGTLLAFASRAVRGGIDAPARIDALLGAHAVQAVIPHSRRQARWRRSRTQGPLLLARAAPDDAAAEGLRAFRAALLFGLARRRNNVVCCLGPARRVGASFVSVNLALLLAAGGRRTLLIDADLRDGNLHEHFGVGRAAGLADCLAGALAPQQAVRREVAPGLDFIGAGSVRAGPAERAELLQRFQPSQLLESLGAHYDVVLLAAPPLPARADALAVAALAGAVFLVARAGVTTEAELCDAIRRLNLAGIAPHGVLYNDA
ncbi:tyrosine protein kinase [Duganella sp. BJB1802]|uniref:GNVR domain-containing protein n=1 Tax=Duganella sp. BJB1802 TaxID=2744575 RepID=UPI001592FA4C|nr:GNVR domain-containing protein [Duganella sp. BJB1802]NVD74319.1 tyrosine protein kinase [Duganella sp. BJB1802]